MHPRGNRLSQLALQPSDVYFAIAGDLLGLGFLLAHGYGSHSSVGIVVAFALSVQDLILEVVIIGLPGLLEIFSFAPRVHDPVEVVVSEGTALSQVGDAGR